MSTIFEKYYLPFQFKNESKESLIKRLDDEYIMSNFDYLYNRDVFSPEDFIDLVEEKK